MRPQPQIGYLALSKGKNRKSKNSLGHGVCCFVLSNQCWGIVTVPGVHHERAKGDAHTIQDRWHPSSPCPSLDNLGCPAPFKLNFCLFVCLFVCLFAKVDFSRLMSTFLEKSRLQLAEVNFSYKSWLQPAEVNFFCRLMSEIWNIKVCFWRNSV